MKRRFPLVLAVTFLSTHVYAHDSLFGSGMYGGLQACPYGYGMPAGVIDVYDDIDANKKKGQEVTEAKKELKDSAKQADKDLREAQKTLKESFNDKFADGIIEHLKSNNRCSDYDTTDLRPGTISDDMCLKTVGSGTPTADQTDVLSKYKNSPPGSDSGGKSTVHPLDLEGFTKDATSSDTKSTSWLESIKSFLYGRDSDLSPNTRMPANNGAGGCDGGFITVGQETVDCGKVCRGQKVPSGISGWEWKHLVCPRGFPNYGEVPPEVCESKSVAKGTVKPSDCRSALKDFRQKFLEKSLADSEIKALDKELSSLKDENKRLSKQFKKEMKEAQTEAVYCPECQMYESHKRYENSSIPSKIGSWVQNLMPLMILGGGAYLNYSFGKDYMDNAAKLGYLTGPTPSFLSYGWPMLLSGVYGSVASAASSAFGCSGGPWGPMGMGGMYGGGGLNGGMGGAFGMPPWMMGMPMGGGALMGGMGPWGMASPFGMMNPMMGGMGMAGMAMMGMGGMAFPGFPMGGFAGVGGLGIAGGMPMMGMPMGGFPMGGMAIGGMGMLAMGGMGMPMGGFPMGGMAIGGMGMLAMGGMGMPMGGFPMGGMAIGGMGMLAMGGMGMPMGGMPMGGMAMMGMGMPMGGMAMMGMPGMGMDMGASMQFQMMMQQQQMAQMNAYMQMMQYQQQQQMAKYRVISSLSQEMMQLQMQIQQVSMGVPIGGYGGFGGVGGIGVGGYPPPMGAPYPPPYPGGGFPPPAYQPPFVSPGVTFPGYNYGGAIFGPGIGR